VVLRVTLTRELHRVASLMNRVIPGSGEAIKAMGHSGDSAALAFIGMAAAIEMVIGALDKMKAAAKAADESLAESLESAGSSGAINAQKKAWEDSDLAQDKFTYKPNVTDEYFAAAKEKTASGKLAKHETLVSTYTDNIEKAKSAAKLSGVTDEDAQNIQDAYIKMGGAPGADLGAMADYVRNHIYTTTAVPLSESVPIANMFSDAVGGLGLNDANFSAYGLAQGDLRRNKSQLDAESAKNFNIRRDAQRAKEDLEASQKVKPVDPGFVTREAPDAGKTPYRLSDEGMARADFNQLYGAYDVLGHGGSLNTDQTRMIQSILGAASGHAVRQDKILSALQTLFDSQKSQDAGLEQLGQQIKNFRNHTTG
jgi:hypothetical protein